MSESKLPMTFLECPYHENGDPHIELDIEKKQELFCTIESDVKRIDKMYYEPLYESAPVKTSALSQPSEYTHQIQSGFTNLFSRKLPCA